MTMPRRVVDLYHLNDVTDFKAAADAGLWGVIHKASQGSTYADPAYAGRRQPALGAGLLWGSYHFNDGSAVAAQVEHFIKTAAPDETTLMVLDYEDNDASNMTIGAAVEFMHLLEQKIGRQAAIYSGNRLKEQIGKLSAADRAYLTSRRLWLAQYGPNAVLPAGFKTWWLWQYTGDGVGPEPHEIAGIAGTGIDLNAYSGTREQLISEWPGISLTVKDPIMTDPAVPATTSDPIPTIINFIETFKNFFLPGIAAIVPAQYKGAVTAAPAVIEEILQGVEDYKNLSGGHLVQAILARAQNVLGVSKTIVTQATSAAPVQATKSEGMPNS